MFQLLSLFFLVGNVCAQSSSTILTTTRALSAEATVSGSATYASYTSTVVISFTSPSPISKAHATNSTGSSSTPATATLLVGTKAASATTLTSTAPTGTNTQPCNGYTEFCNRSYSNITFVAAHNSPFAAKNNLASNQDYDVTTQLNGGIRMLQGQIHMVDGVLHYCHTSCLLLDAGPAEDYFKNVTTWLNAHPFEVVTILIGNGDYSNVGDFVAPIQNSGLGKYAYTPPAFPLNISSWPTLGDLILRNTRAIIFMDYQANQSAVPYILDEFSQLWETPFDPTNNSFPCTVDRPPGISNEQAKDRMYMINHNLNTNLSIGNLDLLLPNTLLLDQTNAVSGTGSLGLAADNCKGKALRASTLMQAM